jgi:hypothetical protein
MNRSSVRLLPNLVDHAAAQERLRRLAQPAAAHRHVTLGPAAGVDLVMPADVSRLASGIARSVSTPGRLAKVRAPRRGRRSPGGSVLQDCSFVRSHSLSSSRATPIEGPGRLRTMTSNERHRAVEGAARRRGGVHRADGDRRAGQAIEARHHMSSRGVGRAWINGREVGGADPRYTHLEAWHD